jgi:hypothetical protein
VLVILYLAFWIFIGNYVLLNLFLAVLLDSFNGDNTIIDDSEFDNLVLSPQVIENFKKITDVRDSEFIGRTTDRQVCQ